jgi:hypothetical protein
LLPLIHKVLVVAQDADETWSVQDIAQFEQGQPSRATCGYF